MIIHAIQALLAASIALLGFLWSKTYRNDGEKPTTTAPALATGAVANFFDTLGIGSFAPTTAIIKFFRLSSDELIPGTLNVGHAIPTIVQALVFIAIIEVDVTLLVSCIAASVTGAVVGARIVSRLPVRAIRMGMGTALLIAAALFALRNLNLLPGGGEAIALTGAAFIAAIVLHIGFGALMTMGVGLYAPSMIALSLLGMDQRAIYPVMMGSCAFLMPAASAEFIRSGRFDRRLALGFAIGGVPAVLVAAFIVKEMPLEILRWIVTLVVIIAGTLLLRSGLSNDAEIARKEA